MMTDKLPTLKSCLRAGVFALLSLCLALSTTDVSAETRWQRRIRRKIEQQLNDQVRNVYLSQVPVDVAKKLSQPLEKSLTRFMKWRSGNQATLELYCEFMVAQGFAFYEESDPEKAAAHYNSALTAASRYLNKQNDLFQSDPIKFETWFGSDIKAFKLKLKEFSNDHYQGLFWFAFSKGMLANLERKTSQIAEVGRLRAIFEHLVTVNPEYFFAGPHLALGLLECILPKAAGRDLERGRKHFEAVQRLTDGKWLLGNLIRAKTYSVALQSEYPRNATAKERQAAARRAWDDYFRQLETIRAFDNSNASEIRLYSKVCKTRAKELLVEAEDYILPPSGVKNPYAED